MLEVEGEREENEEKKRNSKTKNKKEYLNKMGKKKVLGCCVYCKLVWLSFNFQNLLNFIPKLSN